MLHAFPTARAQHSVVFPPSAREIPFPHVLCFSRLDARRPHGLVGTACRVPYLPKLSQSTCASPLPSPSPSTLSDPRPDRVSAAALLVLATVGAVLQGVDADDYQGDYALFAGYRTGCTLVHQYNGGSYQDGFGGIGQERLAPVPITIDVNRTLYARFHVLTPYELLSNQTYGLFVLGGDSDASCGGYTAGLRGDRLFFDVHCDVSSGGPVMSKSVLTGEYIKVEFTYNYGTQMLRIYVDGELVTSEVKAFTAVDGFFTIGAGKHSAFSGTTSPGQPVDSTAEPWMGSFAGNNKYGDFDGGDVFWCPLDWTGARPANEPTTPPMPNITTGGCQPIVATTSAPKWTVLGDSPLGFLTYEDTPMNTWSTIEHSTAFTSGSFMYVRISVTTPEFFHRIKYDAIKLFAYDGYRNGNGYGFCGGILKRDGNLGKLSFYRCNSPTSTEFNNLASGYIFQHDTPLLPLTNYLLEFKINHASYDIGVEMYVNGQQVNTVGGLNRPARNYELALGCDSYPPAAGSNDAYDVVDWGDTWGHWNSGEIHICHPEMPDGSGPPTIPDGECQVSDHYAQHGFQSLIPGFPHASYAP